MSSRPYHLEGLDRLAREHGVDTRATVLRVAADLFAAAPGHTPADIERFEALALPLLDIVDHTTRVSVARRLAPLDNPPAGIRQRLLNDHIEVAREVILAAPRLDADAMLAVALDGGPAEAIALAERADLDNGVARALAAHPAREVVATLIDNAQAPIDTPTLANLLMRARQDEALARALMARWGVDPAACAALYPVVDEAARRRIRAALTEAAPRAAQPLPPEVLDRFRLAVMRGGAQGFSAALAQLLRIAPAAARQLAADPTGELPALAMLACGLGRDEILAALLICTADKVRTSAPVIVAAASLCEDTSRAAALAIVRTVVAGNAPSPRAVHQPHMDPAEPVVRGQKARRARAQAERAALRQHQPKGA